MLLNWLASTVARLPAGCIYFNFVDYVDTWSFSIIIIHSINVHFSLSFCLILMLKKATATSHQKIISIVIKVKDSNKLPQRFYLKFSSIISFYEWSSKMVINGYTIVHITDLDKNKLVKLRYGGLVYWVEASFSLQQPLVSKKITLARSNRK